MGKTVPLTRLLQESNEGGQTARMALWKEVYRELKKLAARYRRKDNNNIGVEPTVLIHETFIRLEIGKKIAWKNRRQFFAMAAAIMRNIVVDDARARCSKKRGGKDAKIPFDELEHCGVSKDAELLALDEALIELAALEPRLASVVELKYFGGYELTEISGILNISVATTKRDWVAARQWLKLRLA